MTTVEPQLEHHGQLRAAHAADHGANPVYVNTLVSDTSCHAITSLRYETLVSCRDKECLLLYCLLYNNNGGDYADLLQPVQVL